MSSAQIVTMPTGANSPFTGLGFRNPNDPFQDIAGMSEVNRNITNGVVFFKDTFDTRFLNSSRTQQITTNIAQIDQSLVNSVLTTFSNDLGSVQIGRNVNAINSSAFASLQVRETLTALNLSLIHI